MSVGSESLGIYGLNVLKPKIMTFSIGTIMLIGKFEYRLLHK